MRITHMPHCHELPVSATTCYIRFAETEKVMKAAEIGTTVRGDMMIADLDASGQRRGDQFDPDDT